MSGTATERLRGDVERLAGYIGERHIWRPEALAQAAAFIRAALVEAGFVPGAQTFEVRGVRVQNVEAIARGASTEAEAIVVGAHYDTIGGSPGANDNGTGIAAVLELARRFAGHTLPRTIRFVAFVNEEPPFFQTEEMGSLVYARAARARGDRILGMLSLETMGYYSDEPGSQQYPDPLGAVLP
jgi:Zn-dependent M28 family amino/carboxypeptidase